MKLIKNMNNINLNYISVSWFFYKCYNLKCTPKQLGTSHKSKNRCETFFHFFFVGSGV